MIHKFDNIVEIDLNDSSESQIIYNWCVDRFGPSIYSPVTGPRMWVINSVPYASNDLNLHSQLTAQFANASDATMFALRWVK